MDKPHVCHHGVAVDPLDLGPWPDFAEGPDHLGFPLLQALHFVPIGGREPGNDEGLASGLVVEKDAVQLGPIAGDRLGVHVDVVPQAHLPVAAKNGVESFECAKVAKPRFLMHLLEHDLSQLIPFGGRQLSKVNEVIRLTKVIQSSPRSFRDDRMGP